MIIFETTVDGVSQASLERFARHAQKLAGVKGEVSVLVSDNRRLRQLNSAFRGKDKPTDVLSFPHRGEPKNAEQNVEQRRTGRTGKSPGNHIHLGGDIAISAEIARENAERYGHPTTDELKILVLHGMLHLAGYDHETDNGAMQKVEAKLRARLKLPGSLIARTQIARAQGIKPKFANRSKRAMISASTKPNGPRKTRAARNKR